MKKLLSTIMASAFTLGVNNLSASAGNGMSNVRDQSPNTCSSTPSPTPFDAPRYPDLPAETIAIIQDNAKRELRKHINGEIANLIDSSVVLSIPNMFDGTARYLDICGTNPSHYLYFPNTISTAETVITTFIPAKSFSDSLDLFYRSFRSDIAHAAELEFRPRNAEDTIDNQMTDIYEQMEDYLSSIRYQFNCNGHCWDTHVPSLQDRLIAMYRIVNHWHLFDILNGEYETLVTGGQDINNFGFLVVEIANNSIDVDNHESTSSGWYIRGPSTFHITTVALH